MANVVVVGAQWGDEGKGKIVDWLSERANVIARFQGGHNAGHTLVIDGEVYKLHALPSGVVRGGQLSVIGNGVVLDPWHLMQEIETVRAQGVEITPETLMIAENTPLILPVHGELDRAREAQNSVAKIGTTGRGIGPAYEDKAARRGIRMADLLHPEELAAKLHGIAEWKNFELVNFYKTDPVDVEALIETAVAWGRELEPYIDHTGRILDNALSDGKNVLFEGAQGTFLDIDHGTYPFVTSSNCVAGAVCTGSGIGPTKIDRVLGITKAYTTRVGAGPFPSELDDALGERLRKAGSEFGATTGRPRRCGWLDVVMLREAVCVNGITDLAINKLDILSGFDELKICIAYDIDGKVTEDFPMTLGEAERAIPVYETLPGWQEDLTAMKSIEEFPKNARRYIERIETLAETPAALLSVGPGRDETIIVREMFSS